MRSCWSPDVIRPALAGDGAIPPARSASSATRAASRRLQEEGQATMNIRRNARVETADGEFGRVTHVIVDPQTHEVTDLVVGRHGSGWLVPIGAVKRADGDVITLHGERERYVKAMPFVRDDYHAVSDRQALEQPGPARHGGA